MGPVAITCDHGTNHSQLVKLAARVLEPLGQVASKMAVVGGLTALPITLRITDEFAAEVNECRGQAPEAYTTERFSGVVGAITLKTTGVDPARVVLVNSGAFTVEDSWALAHFPATLGHEVAHCLIEECRRVRGAPRGYCPNPTNPVETIGHTGLSVCDEFLADELAKDLVEPVSVTIDSDDGETTATDRVILAVDRLDRMCDALDSHVYPALKNAVQQYRRTGKGLEAMTTDLVGGIQGALILSAHYRSACRELDPDLDDVQKVSQHPASRLYLTPFWDRVGPVLDARIDAKTLVGFAEVDQSTYAVAFAAITEVWRALGIRFESKPGGSVYVHVDEPLD